MSTTQVAALVLAAGQGTRFGATKQLAEVGGRPLVRHAVDTAIAAGLDPVIVVVGHDAARVRAALPQTVTVADNPDFRAGQASSLRAGVAAATRTDAEALVVLLGDQPGVSAGAIAAITRAHTDGAQVARAHYDDRAGHPVLFDRVTWPALADLSGDMGARDLLTRLHVVEVAVPGPCPTDIDRPEDLGS